MTTPTNESLWQEWMDNQEEAKLAASKLEKDYSSLTLHSEWSNLKAIGAENHLLMKLALGWEPKYPPPPPPSTELRPPVEVDNSLPLGAIPSSNLVPVDLKQWNQRNIVSDALISGEDIFNFKHIALHHGIGISQLSGAVVSKTRIRDGGKWAGRLYRVNNLVYQSSTIRDILPEHGSYCNMAGGLVSPEGSVALRFHRCVFSDIGGQAVQTVLEEISAGDKVPNALLRVNETPNWEEDIQPGGWILVDGCHILFTGQADYLDPANSRASFALSHFRTRNHVAIRNTIIDNRTWSDGVNRPGCRGHILVQGVEEYTDPTGKKRPQWDRHVLIEDCNLYGRQFQQPIMLLEKGVADIRIRRVLSRSEGGQDWLRINLKPGGNLLIEDWDGPGRLELNGNMMGKLEDGFQS
jgi:hypothetical protein